MFSQISKSQSLEANYLFYSIQENENLVDGSVYTKLPAVDDFEFSNFQNFDFKNPSSGSSSSSSYETEAKIHQKDPIGNDFDISEKEMDLSDKFSADETNYSTELPTPFIVSLFSYFS